MSAVRKQQAQYQYDPVQLLGYVEQIDEPLYVVNSDGHFWHCRRAASCLLAPEIGDEVLISGPNPQQVFLLAVITKANPSSGQLVLPAQVELSAEQLTIRTEQAMKLESRQALALQSEQLQVASEHAQCVVNEMEYVGKRVHSHVGLVRLVGKVYESIVERLSFMSKSSYKVTETVDHSRAGTIDMQAEQSARVHARYTMMTAKDLVKVDADQIHMG